MKKHEVTFYSPGTLFAEHTTREIASWDPQLAAEMARNIVERHGSTPYAFRFSTMRTHEPVDDGEGGTLDVVPKQIASSSLYFLGGRLETLDVVEARKDPKEGILRSNMRINEIFIVCINSDNRYRSCIPFGVDDVLCDREGHVVERGAEPRHVEYRSRKRAELAAKIQ